MSQENILFEDNLVITDIDKDVKVFDEKKQKGEFQVL